MEKLFPIIVPANRDFDRLEYDKTLRWSFVGDSGSKQKAGRPSYKIRHVFFRNLNKRRLEDNTHERLSWA